MARAPKPVQRREAPSRPRIETPPQKPIPYSVKCTGWNGKECPYLEHKAKGAIYRVWHTAPDCEVCGKTGVMLPVGEAELESKRGAEFDASISKILAEHNKQYKFAKRGVGDKVMPKVTVKSENGDGWALAYEKFVITKLNNKCPKYDSEGLRTCEIPELGVTPSDDKCKLCKGTGLVKVNTDKAWDTVASIQWQGTGPMNNLPVTRNRGTAYVKLNDLVEYDEALARRKIDRKRRRLTNQDLIDRESIRCQSS